MLLKSRAAILGALVFCASAAWAQQSAFEAKVKLGGTDLQLNGAGTRYKAMFKVYDAALYLPQKADTPERVYAQTGPRRLHFVALRTSPGTDLGLMLERGMEANNGTALMRRYYKEVLFISEVFSREREIKEGETFRIEFEPQKGVSFHIGTRQMGPGFGDQEFFNAVMRVWLGSSPADDGLKRSLLGQAAQTAQSRFH